MPSNKKRNKKKRDNKTTRKQSMNAYLPNWRLTIFIAILAIYVAFNEYKNNSMAKNLMTPNVFIEKECNYSSYKGIAPNKCGRILIDNFISIQDVNKLINIFDVAFKYSSGGGSGGPSIFDLVSGALSSQNRFINAYTLIKRNCNQKNVENQACLRKKHLIFLREIISKIQEKVSLYFDIDPEQKLFIAAPTFFSKIFANRIPQTMNDEYFHYHIDTVAYGSFSYTALIYLSDYGENNDFLGGKFNFKDGEVVIPTKGKLMIFSSGEENEHRVQNVTFGHRQAFTLAFTFDAQQNAGLSNSFLSEKQQHFV